MTNSCAQCSAGWLLVLLTSLAPAVSGEPLLLTPMLQEGTSAALARARSLSAVTVSNTSFGYSGYFTVPSEHQPKELSNHIYWWYQPCRSCKASEDPLLVWLQGGPGGAGTFGAMTEIGNWYIGDDLVPRERCFSWCEKQSCFFVDQPVETGFSFQTDNLSGEAVTDLKKVDLTDTSKGAMIQIHSVVDQFLTLFPELRPAPLVITGESYGGLYSPNLAVELAADDSINLAGLAMGDPVIDWKEQYPTYADTLYGMGVLMASERDQMRITLAAGVEKLRDFEAGSGKCRAAFDTWNSYWDDDGHDSGGETTGLFTLLTGSTMTEDVLMDASPDSFGNHERWFAKPEVAEAFHIAGASSMQPADSTLSLQVYEVFVDSGDYCTTTAPLYASLLDDTDIDLMIYSSTVDPLLGPPTTEAGINSILRYTDGEALTDAFLAANKTLWHSADDGVSGYAKCVSLASSQKKGRRFCYTVVRNAGHMTPAFQPRSSLDMLYRFLDGEAFEGSGTKTLPKCLPCGGAGPFAGASVPGCQ